MADVARAAGVSHQTVSRVLNDHPNVRRETRERVLAAVSELGYRPNLAARELVTSRSLTVGVVAYNATLYGPARTLYGVERAAHEAGYAVTLATAETDSAKGLLTALEQVVARAVDGIVLVAPEYAIDDVVSALPHSLPAVVVESGDPARVPTVRVDQEAGGRLATTHLLELGHQTVWHVAGPGGWRESAARRRGWEGALRAVGAEVPVPVVGDWSPRSGYEAGLRLADRGDVTAVFVGNDQMALGALRAFRERGVRVPTDCSVVGFDDVPEAEYFAPPLTTVYQDFDEVGRRSIKVLLEQSEDGSRREAVVQARLVVRESSAPRG